MKSGSPPRRNHVRATHQFNRRIAAIGAALALAALPISGTLTPAFAQPSPTPSAAAGSDGSSGTEAADADADPGSSDGADSAAEAGADSSTASADGAGTDSGDSDDSTKTDDDGSSDADEGDNGDDGDDGDKTQDPACKDPADGAETDPCAVSEPVQARWGGSGSKTLKLQTAETAQDNEPGYMPRNWVGKTFKLKKKRTVVRVPVQSSSEDTAQSADQSGGTDDSGNPLPSAAAEATVPDELQFADDGSIVPAGGGKPVVFTGFTSDPKWEFNVTNGQIAVVSGRSYPDTDDGSDSNDADSSKDGTSDNDLTASTDSSRDGSATSSAKANADGTASDGSSTAGSDNSKNTDASEDSDSSSDRSSSSDSSSSADTGATDRANSSSTADADGRDADGRDSDGENSSADTRTGSDGSRSSDSDSSGNENDSDSDKDQNKDSDQDGSGSSLGASDADGNTPDPSNGNGSEDGRATIPGTTGDDWLPGDEDDARHPDYSDPVPRNPDAQTPKDDKDLITGGDQPSPRANQPPAPSFGESIVSTIVSSWPVFVLAASGMAAVGFIIYLMGRRGRQD